MRLFLLGLLEEHKNIALLLLEADILELFLKILCKNTSVRIQEPEGLKNEEKYLMNQFTNLLDYL
ncbi:hypothetical protein BV372_14305 [Nostoc sp. T09]|nr:hypothetical protein BV372_14305 [Nostoc sp. T09]